jgi:hypothetical protein
MKGVNNKLNYEDNSNAEEEWTPREEVSVVMKKIIKQRNER